MIINSSTLHSIYNSFNTAFNKAFAETPVQYTRVAMEVPSDTRDETYAWLGAVPSMREWVGDRAIKNLTAHTYTIKNKDFELTVSVPRNDIEDDCIGALNLNALKFEAFKEKVDNAVTLALTEGKIAPYQRDWAYRNAMNDLDDFVQWCKDALPVVPMGRMAVPPSTVRSRSVCRSDELLGLSPEDIRKFGKAPRK